jgi:hypothetical protein
VTFSSLEQCIGSKRGKGFRLRDWGSAGLESHEESDLEDVGELHDEDWKGLVVQ